MIQVYTKKLKITRTNNEKIGFIMELLSRKSIVCITKLNWKLNAYLSQNITDSHHRRHSLKDLLIYFMNLHEMYMGCLSNYAFFQPHSKTNQCKAILQHVKKSISRHLNCEESNRNQIEKYMYVTYIYIYRWHMYFVYATVRVIFMWFWNYLNMWSRNI